MINRTKYIETISLLRNDAREIYDRACLLTNKKTVARLIEKQSRLVRIANELEEYLRNN